MLKLLWDVIVLYFCRPLRGVSNGLVHALSYYKQLAVIFRTYIQGDFLLLNAFHKLFLCML